MNGIQLREEHFLFLALCLNVYEQDQMSFADFDLIRVLVQGNFGVVSLKTVLVSEAKAKFQHDFVQPPPKVQPPGLNCCC